MSSPPPAGARCAQHPGQAAVDVCQRCGAFVCADCTEIRREDVYCSRCAPLLDRPPTRRIRVVFWVALLWWLPFISFSVALLASWRVAVAHGWWLGAYVFATPLELGVMGALWVQEWAARRRGELSPRGKRYQAGSLVLMALQVLIIGGLLALGALLGRRS